MFVDNWPCIGRARQRDVIAGRLAQTLAFVGRPSRRHFSSLGGESSVEFPMLLTFRGRGSVLELAFLRPFTCVSPEMPHVRQCSV